MKKIKKMLRYSRIAIAAFFILSCFPESFGAPKWIAMRENTTSAKTVANVDETEIMTLPLTVLLSLTQTSKVEVFTILGRLVTRETLAPGNYELQVETHGVYIVKIGDVTCKVAL